MKMGLFWLKSALLASYSGISAPHLNLNATVKYEDYHRVITRKFQLGLHVFFSNLKKYLQITRVSKNNEPCMMWKSNIYIENKRNK